MTENTIKIRLMEEDIATNKEDTIESIMSFDEKRCLEWKNR